VTSTLHSQTVESQIHITAKSAQTRVVELLVRGGAQVNTVTRFGTTPVKAADVVDFLASAGSRKSVGPVRLRR
jgi:hypothetical protein